MEQNVEAIAAEALEKPPVYYKPTGNTAVVDLVKRSSSDNAPSTDPKYTNLGSLVGVADEARTLLNNIITDINDKFRLADTVNNLMVNNMKYNVISNNLSHLVANVKIDLSEIIYEYLAQSGICEAPNSIINGTLFTIKDKNNEAVTMLDRAICYLNSEMVANIVFHPDAWELGRKILSNQITTDIESFIKKALSYNVLGERYSGMIISPVTVAHSRNYKDDTLYVESNSSQLRKVYNDIFKIVTAYFSSDMYSELLENTVDNIVEMAKELSRAAHAVFDIEDELREELDKEERNNEKK